MERVRLKENKQKHKGETEHKESNGLELVIRDTQIIFIISLDSSTDKSRRQKTREQ